MPVIIEANYAKKVGLGYPPKARVKNSGSNVAFSRFISTKNQE